MRKTVMFVVTSHSDLGETGAKTGAWLEELAAPYYIVEAAGLATRIASPAGTAQLDPVSVEAPWLLAAGERFLADEEAMSKLERPERIDEVDAAGIDAVFLVGGTGTVWDFPTHTALGALLTELAANDRPIAAICHGVSGLLPARTADGAPLVQGRRLTSFSNAEEAMLELETVVPLLAETALCEQGARYSCAAPFEAHVVEDGLLLTGQNPASAAGLADRLVARLTGRADPLG